ncbi:hypothetical protein BOTBODRAFT_226333 [Botryobasidium botryosum FD-172 SS1]|uniref:F-box domain-containing protein n=1 Tax=Botryobasidium botryosum (strain FD-172 SS1) TaxID=930990 RepID=A0A067LVC5_BOTB1|nr:hypothetical protein BOTBODRAFT_226333 [Botryobasidium botryosum FD-172 SS1]
MASNNESGSTQIAHTSTQNPSTKGELCRKAGQLVGLIEMPVDIFIEVGTHLLPPDLLSLARASRNIRKLLMSRPSAVAWRRALENMPCLPGCPDDLSEPQYASLLYDRNCHGCGAPWIEKVIFVLRARLCDPPFGKKCLDRLCARETLHRIRLTHPRSHPV